MPLYLRFAMGYRRRRKLEFGREVCQVRVDGKAWRRIDYYSKGQSVAC